VTKGLQGKPKRAERETGAREVIVKDAKTCGRRPEETNLGMGTGQEKGVLTGARFAGKPRERKRGPKRATLLDYHDERTRKKTTSRI